MTVNYDFLNFFVTLVGAIISIVLGIWQGRKSEKSTAQTNVTNTYQTINNVTVQNKEHTVQSDAKYDRSFFLLLCPFLLLLFDKFGTFSIIVACIISACIVVTCAREIKQKQETRWAVILILWVYLMFVLLVTDTFAPASKSAAGTNCPKKGRSFPCANLWLKPYSCRSKCYCPIKLGLATFRFKSGFARSGSISPPFGPIETYRRFAIPRISSC